MGDCAFRCVVARFCFSAGCWKGRFRQYAPAKAVKSFPSSKLDLSAFADGQKWGENLCRICL